MRPDGVVIGFAQFDEGTRKAIAAAQQLGHRVYIEATDVTAHTSVTLLATMHRYADRSCPVCHEITPGNLASCTRCESEISFGEVQL